MVYGVDAAAAYTIPLAWRRQRLFETFEANERKVLPYLEVGLWLLVNVGGGYTVDLNEDDTNASGPHFFIGAPVPVGKPFDGVAYLESLYYRATYADVGTLHEGGAFLKWAKWE